MEPWLGLRGEQFREMGHYQAARIRRGINLRGCGSVRVDGEGGLYQGDIPRILRLGSQRYPSSELQLLHQQ